MSHDLRPCDPMSRRLSKISRLWETHYFAVYLMVKRASFDRKLRPEVATGSELAFESCDMINIIPQPNHYHHKIK